MLNRARYLPLLLVVATALLADKQFVIMPTEIGVSCQKHKPFTAIARTTLYESLSERNETNKWVRKSN
jgi:hypothetical protein